MLRCCSGVLRKSTGGGSITSWTAFLAMTALVAIAFVPKGLRAAEPAWPSDTYDYIVVDQDLRTVLEQYGFNTGLRVVLSDAVRGKVHGRLPPAQPRQFFDHLTQMFGLDWYYDGTAIWISAKSETRTDLISLKNIDFAQLHSDLAAAGFLDERYQLRPGPQNAAIASGPPQYLAMVKQVASSVSPASKPTVQARQRVMIVRGASVTWAEFP
jgi:type III secretion protein C